MAIQRIEDLSVLTNTGKDMMDESFTSKVDQDKPEYFIIEESGDYQNGVLEEEEKEGGNTEDWPSADELKDEVPSSSNYVLFFFAVFALVIALSFDPQPVSDVVCDSSAQVEKALGIVQELGATNEDVSPLLHELESFFQKIAVKGARSVYQFDGSDDFVLSTAIDSFFIRLNWKCGRVLQYSEDMDIENLQGSDIILLKDVQDLNASTVAHFVENLKASIIMYGTSLPEHECRTMDIREHDHFHKHWNQSTIDLISHTRKFCKQ